MHEQLTHANQFDGVVVVVVFVVDFSLKPTIKV